MKKNYIFNMLVVAGILIVFFLLVRFGLSTIINSQDRKESTAGFQHPRTLINAATLADSSHWQSQPVQQMLQVYKYNIDSIIQRVETAEEIKLYDRAYLAKDLAALQAIENNNGRQSILWKNLEAILTNEEIFLNPISRGLTRATLLQNVSLTYDFGYNNFSIPQQERINELMYKVMFTTEANMGHEANYSIASNWMGVRYGSVMLTAYAWDNRENISPQQNQPLLWDATKRMGDHLDANLYRNGWNGESMGYHSYDWMFVGPALIAAQNSSQSDAFLMQNFAPKAINSLHAISTATVNIPTLGRRGMKPDLSDDNLMASPLHLLALGFRLHPQQQHGALKWMHNYFFDPKMYFDDRGLLLYSLLYYPPEVTATNPETLGWLNYHDPEQGVVIFRNRFKDENDIVSLYTATSKRVKGHQGPDTNTFRLIGLGVPWIVGAGRTGEIAGQTNLFPALDETPEKGNTDSLGYLHEYEFFQAGEGGYAIGSGSSTQVNGHCRFYYTSFAADNTAAIVIVKDISENGERWRINTPEFNRIVTSENGFTLVGPNNASLKATVMSNGKPVKMQTGQVRYGGSTVKNNPGIYYQGKGYKNNNWIDVYCDGEITVVFTLQPVNKLHPQIKMQGNNILVDGLQVQVPELQNYK